MISDVMRNALLASTLFTTLAAVPAQAQDRSFNIPRQAVASAIVALGEQAGIQILAARGITAGKQANAIHGDMTVNQAISALLRGTDLTVHQTGPQTYAVVRQDRTSALSIGATASPVANRTYGRSFEPSYGASEAPAVPSPAAQQNDAVGDIVVTAQRRSERLQAVPLSVSVATGELLRSQNINTIQDLGDRIGGLKITKGGASDQLNIRGTGSGFNAGFEQSVATFVDGIYHSRSRSVRTAFFDVERVEVLKGPQTTFFGANAIAGAINITTKSPGKAFEGNAVALYAPTDGEYNLEAGVTVPVSDHLAIRVAGRISGMEGYTKAVRLNLRGPDLNQKQGRISLRWQPTDRLSINARYDIARLRDKQVLLEELVGCSPTTPPLGLCARALGIFGTVDDRLNYHSDSAVPDKSNIDFDEAAVTTKLDLNAVTLVSTTAYLKQSVVSLVDAAPYPGNSPIGLPTFFPINANEDYKQFSQEIRLQSNGDGPLTYMLGGYYEHGNLANNSYLGFYLRTFGAVAVPEYTATTPVASRLLLAQKSDTWSAFGSISYKLIDRLTLTGSLRYSNVRKRARRLAEMGTADQFAAPDSFVSASPTAQLKLAAATGNSLLPFPVDSRTDDRFMPSANVRYEVRPDIMIYASYARGFKAGGFSASTNDTFRPELVDNFELGMKASWLGRRLTTNLAVFQANFSDLQETANVDNGTGALVSVVTNAAKSRTRGVEFTGALRLGHLTLRSDVAYIDSYYVSYPNAPCTPLQTAPGTVCSRDISGATRAYAPKWSGSVGADYRMDLDDTYSIRFGATLNFTSGFYWQPTVSDLVRQNGYAKLDLRAAIGPDDGKWEIAVIGKNITDKLTAGFGTYAPGSPSTVIALPDRPRSVAVQASVKW